MNIGQYRVPARALGAAAIATTALVTISASFFTVDPSERAFVRLLGTPTTSLPYQPGPHLKWPFVSQVDTLQVSQTSLALPVFRVVTIDNQPVELKVDIQYKVPDSARSLSKLPPASRQ